MMTYTNLTSSDLTLDSFNKAIAEMKNISGRINYSYRRGSIAVPVSLEKTMDKILNKKVIKKLGSYEQYEYFNEWTKIVETFWERKFPLYENYRCFPRDVGEHYTHFRINRHMRKKGWTIDEEKGIIKHD